MRRPRAHYAASLLLLVASPVAAEVVQSERTDAVSVTAYRDPDRGDGAIDPHWPGGYALITETRRIAIPAGEAVIRFQGVAEGMLPESAIVTGLPQTVREKNRDTQLLSPAALVDAHLARRVHLKRTDRATGRVREEDAVIRSGPRGGVILETATGVEALGCSGLPEALSYNGVPDGLFARPTLSVLTTSESAVTANVQLSYLAQGFDWTASYVAQVAPDGTTLDLFAWLTLANGGSTGFANASTQVVAGTPNRKEQRSRPSVSPPQLTLQCWPMDGTSTHQRWGSGSLPPPPPEAPMMEGLQEIIVTAMRRDEKLQAVPVAAMVAKQEDLGDLKLYRVPEPVTVAAQSRKQIAMIDQRGVRFDRVYRGTVHDEYAESTPMQIVLRTKNIRERGLGLPLPAGGVTVFEEAAGKPMFVGESRLEDRAVGENVEIVVGESPDVRMTVVRGRVDRSSRKFDIELTNARSQPASAEVEIPYEIAHSTRSLAHENGKNVWRVVIPANGSAHLRYKLKLEAAVVAE